MSELLVMRHATATWGGGISDFDRPLSEDGERDCARVGAWLRERDLVPRRILSSPAVRAVRTARLTAEALGLREEDIVREERLYGADLWTLLAVLGELPPEVERAMLVGHNPGLIRLAAYLASDGTAPGLRDEPFYPATLAHLRLPGGWEALEDGSGELVAVVRPGPG